MGQIELVVRRLQNLDRAIDDALEHEVADVAKEVLKEKSYENVYSYAASPWAMSARRYEQGGIADTRNMNAAVSKQTLIVTDDAPWRDGFDPMPLREAIASGYLQGNAGPRPFHKDAETELISSGRAESALRAGLARQGIALD